MVRLSIALLFGLIPFAAQAQTTPEGPAADGGFSLGPEPDPASIEVFEVDAGPTSSTASGRRMNLRDAIQRALDHNPTMGLAHAEVDRAKSLVGQARAGWFPTLTQTTFFLHQNATRYAVGQPETPSYLTVPQNQLNASLVLNVPIFWAQKWELQWEAEDNVAVQQATDADTRRIIAVSVARAYLTVIAQERIIDAAQRAVVADAAHRDFAQQRYSGGIGNRVDLVRAQQELAADQVRLEQALSGLSTAREALGVLVAVDGPVEVTSEAPLGDSPTLQAALGDSLSRRNDVVSLDDRAHAADRAVRAHWTDFTPILTAVAQPFLQDPPISTAPGAGWFGELLLTWPIYDGGLRYAVQQERNVLAREAHLNVEEADRQVLSDVRAAFVALEHADHALGSARDAAKLAHEGLDLANLAYRAGANTNIEVIDAERTALDADTNSAVAEDSARQARLDLLAASGRFP